VAGNIVYSRSTASVQPDYKTLAAQGVTVALSADDPHLAEQIARARENGMNPAIWIPATNGADATEYGKKMAGIVQQYQPSSIIPNVEADGKGYAGSKGYNWSNEMMAEYAKYVPKGTGPPLSVSVMGEKDFNYNAYLNYGGDVQAETFDGKMNHKNVDQVRADLLAAGVPENKITMLLAPGQSPQNWKGQTAGYTLDDMNPDQYRQWQSYAAQSPASTSAPGAPTPQAAPLQADGYSQVPDAQDPRAVRYAQQRLAQLQKQGYSAKDFGITGDPTAQWRGMSAIAGARQAIASGHAADYHIPAGTSPDVATVINQLIAAAGPSTDMGQGGDVHPIHAVPQPPAPTHGLGDALTAQQRAIIASINPNSQHTATPGPIPAVPRPAPLQPHQLVPLASEAQRVGPMQQAIQVAATMRQLRQLTPAPTSPARFE
jgi:hypothetical protein